MLIYFNCFRNILTLQYGQTEMTIEKTVASENDEDGKDDDDDKDDDTSEDDNDGEDDKIRMMALMIR